LPHDAEPAVQDYPGGAVADASGAGAEDPLRRHCHATSGDGGGGRAAPVVLLQCAIETTRRWSLLRRMALAAAVVLVALLVRLPLHDVLAAEFVHATFFPAVAIAAVFGRLAGGIVAVALSVLAVRLLPAPVDVSSWSGDVAFVLGGLAVAGLAEALHVALDHLAEWGARAPRTQAMLQLSALVDSTDDAVMSFDLDGRITSWNRAAERLFGYTASEAIGREADLLVAPLGRILPGETARGAFDHASSGQRFQRDTLRVAKDGTVIDVSVVASLIRAPDGRAIGVSAIMRDIRERRSADAALRESEQQLRFALSGAHAAAWQWNVLTGEQIWSPEGYALHGRDPALGPPDYGDWLACLHPEDRIAMEQVVREAATGRTADFRHEYRVLLAGGEVRWLSSLGNVEFTGSGQPLRMSGINLDITERKRAEEQFAAAKQRLDAHIDNSPLGVIEFDPEFRIERWSAEAESMFGWSAADVIGRAIDDLRWVHEDDAEMVRDVTRDMIDGRRPRNLTTNRNYRKDGSILFCEWYNSAIYDTQGRLASIFSQVLDVTERRQALEELEQRVAERTAALQEEMKRRQAAQSALAHSQRLEALGRLAGGLTHDFNNTLAAVSAQLEMAESRVSDEVARDCLSKALDAVEMGASLNRRLLTFARRGAGTRQTVDCADRIATLVGLLRRTLGEAVTIETRIADDLWKTRLDPGELESAIINLVVNARDAMPDGGSLTIAAENVALESHATVTDSSPRSGEFVKLTVSDTGTGMAPDVLQRAGEPFFTTKGAAKGTGLGLSSVREFVRGADGFMIIDSVVGSGTTVALFLKRAVGGTGERRSGVADRNVPLGDGEPVLLVEDDERVLEAAHALLEGLGYAVLDARSGAEAMALLAEHSEVKVVLSDIVMPGGMSGYDVARRVLAERPGTAIVLASGFNIEDRRQDDALQGLPVLRKPYSRAALAEALHAALHG
jgi:PAS domain S-box-containing protein